ncbi:MAG: arginine deiminase [Actinomycetaceae bacterium]|nr:arginine deiminase [Actinomycetaceae bacterium]
MPVGVHSEVGPLEEVIVYRPGREMDRLTPSNKDDLLFDDVLWLSQARRDHDVFTKTLSDQGVKVLCLNDLLKEALQDEQARSYVVEVSFADEYYGVTAAAALQEYAKSLTGSALGDFLIDGMTKRELDEFVGHVPSTYFHRFQGDDLVTPCLPNLYFTRDPSAWIYGGVSVNAMQMRARRREAFVYNTVYRWHPRFKGEDFDFWSRGANAGYSTVEGGDILVPGNGVVLVGLSQRTTPAGVERLAQSLFRDPHVRTVVGIMMGQERAQMHLDTVMTMVDERTFMKYQHLGMLETVVIERGPSGGLSVRVKDREDMHRVIANAMGVGDLRFLTTPESGPNAERGQWNDSCNLLALRPGVVVAYDRNERANEYLMSEGVQVLTVPGGELGRGRGGPRCMSCPVVRGSVVVD